MEEAPTLQQYSKQLNVYDSTDTHRGRLFINAADLLEISYKAGISRPVRRTIPFFELAKR
jgi:hypothetical protein